MTSKQTLNTIKTGCILTLIGISSIILHWTYAEIIFLIGLSIIFIMYPIRFYLKSSKTILSYSKVFFILFNIPDYATGVMHWNYPKILEILSLISLIVLIISLIREHYFIKPLTAKISNIEIICYSIGIIGICIGALLKIMHWPYGTMILITGILSAILSIVVTILKSRS